ncbi:NAD(P)H-binding protein [Solidesulfovibrio sp.]|uniref:NAD(P)-dependent oxidoreductase n=1 Tax=Solidesulfovibrio sp. TaxID=2910990 RepID=UPI0026209FA8|nr:NAD(P)H-binding protein [Solidesulfovibrio sp.]
MRIAIIGATGYVGSVVLQEALARGHEVTAVVRHVEKLPSHPKLTARAVDVADVAGLAEALAGSQAVIHAYAPPRDLPVDARIAAQRQGTRAILDAMKRAGVGRILAVGGAGTLVVPGGGRNMDRPDFPKEWEGGARSTAEVKEMLRLEPGIEWTFLSPSHLLVPGERTGAFRLGLDELLVGPDGESRVSLADYAMALLDELETPKHTGRRFTVGY